MKSFATKFENYGETKTRGTLKALANVGPGRGPRACSPGGVEVFALKRWGQKCEKRLFATLMKGLSGYVVNNVDATPTSRGCAFEK